jgi:hypothetical protein
MAKGPKRAYAASVSSVDRIAIAELQEDHLRTLIAGGETVAERKAKVPADGLATTVAAFANTAGGWILLGVSNDGEVVGFSVPGRAEPQDWLRNHLRGDVDPMPPFRCRRMAIDGHDVVVVRVYASEQTPHIVTQNGSIYVREHGGKQPIRSQAALLALSVKPEQAEADTISRMTRLPLVTQAFAQRDDLGEPISEQTRVSDWLVSVAPLAVPEGFRAKGLASPAKMRERVLEQLGRLGPPDRSWVQVRPHATGVSIDGANQGTGHGAHLMLDAGGVVVGRVRVRLTRGAWHVGTTADEVITPLLALTLDTLADCGVTGKVLAHLHIRICATADEYEPVLSLQTHHDSGELYAPPENEMFCGGDIELPVADGGASALAERWMREIARQAGIGWWEHEPTG